MPRGDGTGPPGGSGPGTGRGAGMGGSGREEWVAPEPVQALGENACVQNAERLLPMKQERRVTL